jgi:hypothetical protein
MTILAEAIDRALGDLSQRASNAPTSNLFEIFGGEDARMFLTAMSTFCHRGGFEVTTP